MRDIRHDALEIVKKAIDAVLPEAAVKEALQNKGLLHSRQLTHLISPPLLEVNKHHPGDRMHLVCYLGHHGILIHITPLPSESFLPQLAVPLSL